MSKKFITWAVVPARSGSKGIKHKNIISFLKKPLLAHSINFAKKLNFIDKIILSTDSEKYKKIGKKFGAEVPFLRSKKASMSNSMEEDVLEDIRLKLIKENRDLPDFILWLRPTHPLRDPDLFEKAFLKFRRYKEAFVLFQERTQEYLFLKKINYYL